MASVEQEKNRRDARLEQEKNRQEGRINSIRARIDSLRDSKQSMVLQMASSTNEADVEALSQEITGIQQEIESYMEESNSIAGTPLKSNRSPN